jgi:hypothetical protein
LKNLPLRLEPIGLHELPALPLLLDDVISSSSLLSSLEVEDIPDNQFVCFLAQIIRFSDAKPVQLDDVKHMPTGTTFFAADDAQFMVSELIRYQLSNDMDESLSGDFPPTLDLWNRVIVDKESHQRIGHTAICGEHPGPENATKAPTLVYLKCNYKNVIAVEVVKRQGVCYKVNVARIERTYWFDAASSREVIVLG